MKLTKLLIGSTIALPATIVPLSTITSCAQSWGNLSAFSIGGATTSEGPYANVSDDSFDFDGVPYANYLQSNYSIKQSSGSAYAYSSPMKWDKDKKEWVLGESAWYQNGSSAFQSTATYKDDEGKTQTSTNARNATLSTNIAFVNSIGVTINNYLSKALQYQASQISLKEKTNKESVKIAWGEGASTRTFHLNFGPMGSDIIQHFFEAAYANANLNGAGKSSAMLRTSNTSFKFVNFPLPSYNFSSEPHSPDNRIGFTDNFISILEGSSETREGYNIDTFQYYSTKSKVQLEGDPDEHYVFEYNNVPIRITINSLTQSYLNPQLSSSFLVNDYYSSDNQVKSTIANQWKTTMPSITGKPASDAIPHYKTFKWTTPDDWYPIFPPSIHDTRLSNPHDNEFVALINYKISVYTRDNAKKKDTAAITGVSNIFPAYWLDIFRDKQNMYKTVRKDCELYAVNSSYITELAKQYNNLVQRSNGKLASELTDQTSKNFLAFLGYMFADSDNRINTQNILSLKDEIAY